MLKKLSLIIALLIAAFSVGTAAASADTAGWKVDVGVLPMWDPNCMVTSDMGTFYLSFQGKSEAQGIEPPNKLHISYQIYDQGTKWIVASRVVNILEAQNWLKGSRSFTMLMDHKYTLRLKMSYQVAGHTFKRTYKRPLKITAEDWAGMPTC